MSSGKKKLLKFVGIVLIFVVMFICNPTAAILLLAACIIYLLIIKRARVFSMIGSVNYSRGNIDNAVMWFEKAYKSKTANCKTITSYGYLLLKSGNIEKSEKIFNEVLCSKSSEDEKMYAKSNLALVLWKKEKLDEAVSMLQEVLENYETSTIYGSLGYLLILKDDLDASLEFNLKAYDFNSSNTVILDNLGQTYYLRHQYDEAEKIFKELIALNPAFPEAYYNYGLVLWKKGETQNALDYMKKSLNYNFSFLSAITRQEVESGIQLIENEPSSNPENKMIED